MHYPGLPSVLVLRPRTPARPPGQPLLFRPVMPHRHAPSGTHCVPRQPGGTARCGGHSGPAGRSIPISVSASNARWRESSTHQSESYAPHPARPCPSVPGWAGLGRELGVRPPERYHRHHPGPVGQWYPDTWGRLRTVRLKISLCGGGQGLRPTPAAAALAAAAPIDSPSDTQPTGRGSCPARLKGGGRRGVSYRPEGGERSHVFKLCRRKAERRSASRLMTRHCVSRTYRRQYPYRGERRADAP